VEVQLAPPVDRDVGEDGGRHQAHQLGPVDLGPTGLGRVDERLFLPILIIGLGVGLLLRSVLAKS